MKLNLKLNNKYIIGVSYGPDSMALLDLLLKNHYNFVVCHINYHLREESNEEQKKLENYLKLYNIKYYIKEVSYKEENKNIEAWARDIRYTFFKEICKKEATNHIVIAHNEDDLIETYLIQKKRNGIVSRYGLTTKYKENGFIFYRPLLKYSKDYLLKYCNKFHIPYSIDKSNFDTKYLRNNLRINYVSKLTKEERKNIKKDIFEDNRILKNKLDLIKSLIHKTILTQEDILQLDVDLFNLLIVEKLKIVGISYGFSKKFALDIYLKIKNDINFEFKNNKFMITYSYKTFLISQNINKNYLYIISNLQKNDIFKIHKKSKFYPLIQTKGKYIKNVSKNDYLEINGIRKKVSRLFIDQHMPKYLRNIWPGVYDENDVLLYTPHYQENGYKNKESVILFNDLVLIKCFLLYKIK